MLISLRDGYQPASKNELKVSKKANVLGKSGKVGANAQNASQNSGISVSFFFKLIN